MCRKNENKNLTPKRFSVRHQISQKDEFTPFYGTYRYQPIKRSKTKLKL